MKTDLRQKNNAVCFWEQAGVVPRKACFKDFNCNTCRFDRALNRVCRENQQMKTKGVPLTNKTAGFEFWQDRMMRKPLAKRPCIHHMKGHIEFKNCLKAYNCIDCEFDQYFYDQFKVNTVLKPVDFDNFNGVSLPVGYYLHPGHTWIKIEDQGMVRVGVDDFACRLLGDFDTVSLPLMGKKLEQGKPAFTLKRDGHDAGFLSPVSGVVTEVNHLVGKTPGAINKAPYEKGWIVMLYCPDLKNELKTLMLMDTSKQFMNREINRLYTFIEEETQMKAADGGSLVPDIYGNLPHVSWQTLIDRFICP